jgi:cytochrome c-type biogenesis protein CcmH/NrfG
MVLSLVATAPPVMAQQQAPPRLALSRTLTVGPAPGCAIAPTGQAAPRRDNAEARRLAAAGQEAALIGDQATARDAFARAAALNPGDERLSYDLARAHEELGDAPKAIAEFCRHLAMSPNGREAADVRDRLKRLVPADQQRRAADVQVAFRLGLALFDDGRYDAAIKAFDDVVRNAPESPEGFRNRGLARAARGSRQQALQDLEQYRVNAPTVDDRVDVGRAIEVLRRPVYSRSGAFVRSLVPGLGQFYTGHSLRGVIVLAGAAGGAAMAFTQQTSTETVPYVDPNGVPAPFTRTTRERSYFAPGLGAAGALMLVGMIDAVTSASRSQRGGTVVELPARKTADGSRTRTPMTVTLLPTVPAPGGAGLGLSLRY